MLTTWTIFRWYIPWRILLHYGTSCAWSFFQCKWWYCSCLSLAPPCYLMFLWILLIFIFIRILLSGCSLSVGFEMGISLHCEEFMDLQIGSFHIFFWLWQLHNLHVYGMNFIFTTDLTVQYLSYLVNRCCYLPCLFIVVFTWNIKVSVASLYVF